VHSKPHQPPSMEVNRAGEAPRRLCRIPSPLPRRPRRPRGSTCRHGRFQLAMYVCSWSSRPLGTSTTSSTSWPSPLLLGKLLWYARLDILCARLHCIALAAVLKVFSQQVFGHSWRWMGAKAVCRATTLRSGGSQRKCTPKPPPGSAFPPPFMHLYRLVFSKSRCLWPSLSDLFFGPFGLLVLLEGLYSPLKSKKSLGRGRSPPCTPPSAAARRVRRCAAFQAKPQSNGHSDQKCRFRGGRALNVKHPLHPASSRYTISD
jgi:hypothetical protein